MFVSITVTVLILQVALHDKRHMAVHRKDQFRRDAPPAQLRDQQISLANCETVCV